MQCVVGVSPGSVSLALSGSWYIISCGSAQCLLAHDLCFGSACALVHGSAEAFELHGSTNSVVACSKLLAVVMFSSGS